MSQNLLEKFIRVRVTKSDREFIEQYTVVSGQSISELFRALILEFKKSKEIC